MNIQVTRYQSSTRPNAERLHVLPDTKDQVFAQAQVESFEKSAENYLEAYDQVGRSGAARGLRNGALISSTLGAVALGGALCLMRGDAVSMAIGTCLGLGIASTLGAIIVPATVDGTRRQAQSNFVSQHSAPYLENGPDCWLTADGFPLHARNGQTHDRLS